MNEFLCLWPISQPPKLYRSVFSEADFLTLLSEEGNYTKQPSTQRLIDQIFRWKAKAACLFSKPKFHFRHSMPASENESRASQPIGLAEIESKIEEFPNMTQKLGTLPRRALRPLHLLEERRRNPR